MPNTRKTTKLNKLTPRITPTKRIEVNVNKRLLIKKVYLTKKKKQK